jgi:hypothetical protein
VSTGATSNNVVDLVLEALPTQEPGLSYAEIEKRIDYSKVTIRHTIRKLIAERLVHRAGSDRAPKFCRDAVCRNSSGV